MPPEPSPWDRKDFFRERKHERSEFLGGGGGGPGGFGGGTRWREHPGNNHHYNSSSRWAPRYPSGHGKQGGWHMYPDEPAHEFMASRSSDKILEEDNGRYSGYRGEGRYSRNGRENRGSFGQRDWRGHSWDIESPNGPGRINDPNDQRFGDGMMNYHSAQPHSDYTNSRDQTHSRDQHNKNGLVSDMQRNERESSLGSIEWKHLKWTRPGSLSSRGSFSHSSSSKSTGLASKDTPIEMHPQILTPIKSTSGDTIACVTTSAPLEDSNSRKKPRLGWGEGLAKFEKKRVDGPEDSPIKIDTVNSSSNLEVSHFSSVVKVDKNPQGTGSTDCTSPTTPLSVACSSSPGIEEKQFSKEINTEHNLSTILGSPSAVSLSHPEDSVFNLEGIDVTKISNLNAIINELLRSDDSSPTDSDFKRSSKLNLLLSWKNDVTKVLEKTEIEIDMLENELKSLNSGTEHRWHGLSSFSSLPKEFDSKPFEVQADGDKVNIVEIDSPGSATSKLVEVLLTEKETPVSEPKHGEALLESDVTHCRNLEDEIANIASLCEQTSQIIAADVQCLSDGNLDYSGDFSCETIYASNRESANRVAEVFRHLLPANDCGYDLSKDSSVFFAADQALKEKIIERKRQQLFKEKALALKFRVFHHLWKEEVNMLSLRKFRTKSQRKFELSRTMLAGHHKNRLSSRSRPSAVGNLNLVPTPDLLNFTSRLLLDSNKVKAYRSTERMPALILDKKEKILSRFISNNALVEDPLSSEKERSMINPWTSEEREIFIDKLATFGKDFKKIASFLDHKTTADCIEFYYKNHKSEAFVKAKRKPCYAKQGKATYLVASGKRWNNESNAASLDILGAVSAIAAKADDGVRLQTCSPKYHLDMTSEIKQSNGADTCNSDRETVAADVLAGICGSLSSVASEVMQPTDEETGSDDSSGEVMDSSDWTDEEKLTFIQAVSSHGKDFTLISNVVKTRSREQCKIFFSKARKCLGLDAIVGLQPSHSGGDVNPGSRSDDPDSACSLLETDSICNEKPETPKMESNPEPDFTVGSDEAKPGLNSPEDLDSIDTGHVDKPELLESTKDVENGTEENILSPSSCKEAAVETEKVSVVGALDAVQNSTEGHPPPECSVIDNCDDDCLTKASSDSDESETRMKSDVSSSMQGSNNSVPMQSVSSRDSTLIIASESCSNVNGKLANLNPPETPKPSMVAEKQISEIKENGKSWRSGRLSTASGCILQKCSSTSSSHDSLSEMEKACDFKLFGQILSKPSSTSRQNSSCSSTQVEEGSSKLADGVSSSSENSHLLLTYGYWEERNRKPSEATTIMLGKYPAAFGSYTMPSSSSSLTAQMEVTNGRDRQHFGGGRSILVGAGAVQCNGGAPDPAVVAAIKKVPYAMAEK